MGGGVGEGVKVALIGVTAAAEGGVGKLGGAVIVHVVEVGSWVQVLVIVPVEVGWRAYVRKAEFPMFEPPTWSSEDMSKFWQGS